MRESWQGGRMETLAKVLIVVMASLNGLVLLLNAGLKKYVEEKVTHLATKEDLADLVIEVRQKAVASKEGEISAIQNKLDTVVEQNRAIVLSSEEIKRQVSSRQRMWELKREAAYDALKLVVTINHVFAEMITLEVKDTRRAEAIARLNDAMHTTWRLQAVFSFLFADSVSDLLDEIFRVGMKISKDAVHSVEQGRQDQIVEFHGLRKKLITALQDELK